MKPSGISPSLLEKYLSGECTDEEKELVEAWYASIQGETRYLDHLPDAEVSGLREDTFRQIRGELNMASEKPVRIFQWRWLAGIAASLLLVLGIYAGARFKKAPVIASQAQSKKVDVPDFIRFENTQQRIVTHLLPDSSSIVMHPGAVVTYPPHFPTDKRLVDFSGEAFFDIKKDKSRPFFIKSNEMVIRVLGTSFNVKAVADQKTFQVDVVTGTVQVTAPNERADQQEVILKPQQQALFELGSKKLISKTLPAQTRKEIYEPVTIVFEEAPLNQVISQLEKRFKAHIILSDPGLAKCSLTANFESQTFASIMEVLCASLEVTYTISDNTITISGEPCE